MANGAPLRNGQRVAVIGGGPSGVGAALTLQTAAAEQNIELDVILFECKRFGEHHNQCLGVLSPPLLSILRDDFGFELPTAIVQRSIKGYVLASRSDEVTLDSPQETECSHAVRRVQFDSFLLDQARASGVQVVCSRVTDMEISRDGVMIYSDSGNWKADAVIGAFGLDHSMADVFKKRTSYRPPIAIETIVTKVHPAGLGRIDGLLGDRIYAYLPPIRRIEFGALVPKANHVSVVIAGKDVRSNDMDSFLGLPEVARMLPSGCAADGYFKGIFPLGLASGIYGDRYVVAGDAAGLVRPFKGKGINNALVTGRLAARTMIEKGISAGALRNFYDGCRELAADVAYGRFMRFLAIATANYLSVERVIALAKRDERVRQALFDCVSGNKSFREIVRGNLDAPFVARVLTATFVRGLIDRIVFKRARAA